MSCSDEDATFVAWVVLFGGFFDSNELKLTRWKVDSEEECRFTAGCCTLTKLQIRRLLVHGF